MATLETFLEANYDRQVGRQADGQKKPTYRGLSYHSAQKLEKGGESKKVIFIEKL